MLKRRREPALETIDFVDNQDVSSTFLRNPLDWRVRAVEQIILDRAHHCYRRRSLQVAPLRPLFEQWQIPLASTTRFAILAIPVASVPRGPLISFDVEGPIGPAYLLSRHAIAERQAHYIASLADRAGIEVTTEARALFTAMMGMPLTDVLSTYGTERFRPEKYLADGLGTEVDPDLLATWTTYAESIRSTLRNYDTSEGNRRASRDPLVALPEAYSLAPTKSLASLTTGLRDGSRTLLAAAQMVGGPSNPNFADELLASMGSYATDFEMFVATKVPLDEPFLLKYAERRVLALSLWGRGSQRVLLSDAGSNHVVLETTDPNTRLSAVRAVQPGSTSPSFGNFSSTDSRQAWTLYSSDADREYEAELQFRVQPHGRFVAVPLVVGFTVALLIAGLWMERPSSLSNLAVVAGPAALAATVLLGREQSTLGSQVRRLTDRVLLAVLVALIVSCAALYLLGHLPSVGVGS